MRALLQYFHPDLVFLQVQQREARFQHHHSRLPAQTACANQAYKYVLSMLVPACAASNSNFELCHSEGASEKPWPPGCAARMCIMHGSIRQTRVLVFCKRGAMRKRTSAHEQQHRP